MAKYIRLTAENLLPLGNRAGFRIHFVAPQFLFTLDNVAQLFSTPGGIIAPVNLIISTQIIMKKYNIIRVNHDYTTTIQETHLHHKDAIESLTNSLNDYKTEEKEKYYKVYYESKDEITINYCGWSGKSLHAKYFIIEYEDDTDIRKPMEFIKSKV